MSNIRLLLNRKVPKWNLKRIMGGGGRRCHPLTLGFQALMHLEGQRSMTQVSRLESLIRLLPGYVDRF